MLYLNYNCNSRMCDTISAQPKHRRGMVFAWALFSVLFFRFYSWLQR